MNAESMKKLPEPTQDEQTTLDLEMRDEYDFRNGVRGKYVHRLSQSIQRDMVPEHARETWDAEEAALGELISKPRRKTATEED